MMRCVEMQGKKEEDFKVSPGRLECHFFGFANTIFRDMTPATPAAKFKIKHHKSHQLASQLAHLPSA
jgi:hypothetical protein